MNLKKPVPSMGSIAKSNISNLFLKAILEVPEELMAKTNPEFFLKERSKLAFIFNN